MYHLSPSDSSFSGLRVVILTFCFVIRFISLFYRVILAAFFFILFILTVSYPISRLINQFRIGRQE